MVCLSLTTEAVWGSFGALIETPPSPGRPSHSLQYRLGAGVEVVPPSTMFCVRLVKGGRKKMQRSKGCGEYWCVLKGCSNVRVTSKDCGNDLLCVFVFVFVFLSVFVV